MVLNAVEGKNTSIMVYGVTGSGKTHTMFGNHSNQTQDIGILE